MAYARVAEFRIRLRCRKPYGEECSHAAGCLSGLGAFPRRRGIDTLPYWLPLVPGKGMSGWPDSLPTPCRREDSLHVSQPVSTERTGGSSQCKAMQAMSCLLQTTFHLVLPGIRHRSMAQVRVVAGWLCEWQNKKLLLACDGGRKVADRAIAVVQPVEPVRPNQPRT